MDSRVKSPFDALVNICKCVCVCVLFSDSIVSSLEVHIVFSPPFHHLQHISESSSSQGCGHARMWDSKAGV